MIDALDRVEPVARQLVARIDAVLVRHGAPADHQVWSLLRRLAVTPSDAVEFAVALDPGAVRAAADRIRAQIDRYAAHPVPRQLPWSGPAAQAFAEVAGSLAAHLGGSASLRSAAADPDTLLGRLLATASYVDDLAGWCVRSRAAMATTLADVLSSAEAVILWSTDVTGPGAARALPTDPMPTDPTPAGPIPAGPRSTGPIPVGPVRAGPAAVPPIGVVVAAADLGAHLLAAADAIHQAGHRVLEAWPDRLARLPYHPPALSTGPGRAAAVWFRP
jgi:hypothetical protein